MEGGRSAGQILAVRILAAKLPNSDLNFAMDFGVDFFPPVFSFYFFRRKKTRKNPPKNPPQNSRRTLFGKVPLGFLQKPSLDKLGALHFCPTFPKPLSNNRFHPNWRQKLWRPQFCRSNPPQIQSPILSPVTKGQSRFSILQNRCSKTSRVLPQGP